PYTSRVATGAVTFAGGPATVVDYTIDNPGITVSSTGRYYLAIRPVSNGTSGRAFWVPSSNPYSHLFQGWRHLAPSGSWTTGTGASATNEDFHMILTFGTAPDCNTNALPDACELSGNDCDGNGTPDVCDADCNTNGTADECDVQFGGAVDCDGNNIPDL